MYPSLSLCFFFKFSSHSLQDEMEPGFQLEYQRYLKEVSDLLNADEGFQGAIKNSGPNAQVLRNLYYKWIALILDFLLLLRARGHCKNQRKRGEWLGSQLNPLTRLLIIFWTQSSISITSTNFGKSLRSPFFMSNLALRIEMKLIVDTSIKI